MRRTGQIFALTILASTLALAQARGAESSPAGASPGEQIKQGFVALGHGVRDGAVSVGHGVRDGSVKAWTAVKSAVNGKGDGSDKEKAPPPRKSSSAPDSQ
jgi:hypothetical protein